MSFDPQFLDIKSRFSLYGIQRAILWDRDCYDTIQNYMSKIRMYEWLGDHQSAFNLTEILNELIKKAYDDHKPHTLYKDKVNVITADISHNKITSAGITASDTNSIKSFQ